MFLSSVMQVHDILCSTGGGIQEFGRIFFDDLFRNDPELRDRLFREHSIGVLVFRLEVMISEMLRLARLERPLDLAAQATEVALSFLENGLQEEDLENCKSTALDTLRKVMVGRGSKWGRAQAKACVWLLDLLAALVLETLWTAGPKAKLVRDTWRSLCSELAPKDGGHGAVVSSPALSTTQKGFGLQALSYQGTSGKSGLLSAISRSNRVIPGAESLLPAEGPGSGNHGTTRFRRPSFSSTAPLLPPSHQDRQSPISPHIHAEADQQGPDRPRGLSRKISSVIEMISSAFAGQSSGPNDTLANPTSPNLTEEASGIRHPSPATRDLIKTSVAISRVRGKFKALLARKSEFETGEGMQMWKKKATASGISKEYVLGRRNAGRMLVSALVGLGRPGRLLCDVLGAGTQSVADEAGLLMEIIANACTRPYLLSQRVRVMAVAYSRTGLTPAMLHFFEDSILNVLETALAPAGKWPPGAAESWTWAWQAVQHSMLQHMGRANNVLTALQRSWGLIRQNGLEMKLAERFYDKMLSSHTNKMQSIFSRPKQMQYALFTQALDLVVRSVQDPEHMRTEVESLAMKHIKYNITREHVDIFGQLLIEALQVWRL